LHVYRKFGQNTTRKKIPPKKFALLKIKITPLYLYKIKSITPPTICPQDIFNGFQMTQPKRYKQIRVMVNGDLSPSMFWLHSFLLLLLHIHIFRFILFNNAKLIYRKKNPFKLEKNKFFLSLYPPTAYFFNVCCSSMLYNPLILFYLPTFFYKRVSDEYNDYKNVGKKIYSEKFF